MEIHNYRNMFSGAFLGAAPRLWNSLTWELTLQKIKKGHLKLESCHGVYRCSTF